MSYILEVCEVHLKQTKAPDSHTLICMQVYDFEKQTSKQTKKQSKVKNKQRNNRKCWNVSCLKHNGHEANL